MLLFVQGPSSSRAALVVEDMVEVFDAPDPGGVPTARLKRGERVSVRREEPGGWLAISPPPGSFSWVDDRSLVKLDDGLARVEEDQAQVRSGRPGARLPGAVLTTLPRSAEVVLLDRPPLVLGSGDSRRRWLAIEPVREEVRYLLADGVEIVGARSGRSVRADSAGTKPGPSWFRNELATLDARHRVAVSGPVDQWDLVVVRKGYEDLLARVEDDAERSLVAERLRRVDLQREVAAVAGEFQSRLRASRARDQDLSQARKKLDDQTGGKRREYAAVGILQRSTETLEGSRLYVLIGQDGRFSAYVAIPPTLSISGLLGTRVGLVGEVHYRQELNLRMIEVRDIDLIERGP